MTNSMTKTKLAICGLGNLGRAAMSNISAFPDLEIVAVVSRRKIEGLGVPVVMYDEAPKALKGKVDVMLMCGGSATDLPVQTPFMAQHFNVVDSFDNHAQILQHRKNVDESARKNGNTAVISVGWDPGLFSLARAYFGAFLPNGTDHTFWGKGVSQGHSYAVRQIEGVKNAIQYTVPKAEAIQRIKGGNFDSLGTRDKHERIVYLVAHDGADKDRITKQIVTMPSYFADYDTTVNFITDDEFNQNHTKLPHGGNVIRSGSCGNEKQLLELSIKLDSNPLFTSSIMLAYARAAHRLSKENTHGCHTAFDIAVKYLCEQSVEEVIGQKL